MRILFLHDLASPQGGAEVIVGHLVRGMRERGHDARLFSTTAAGVGMADYHCFGTQSKWRTLVQVANPSAYLRLREVLAEFRPELVHVRIMLTQLSPLILPLLAEYPCIYHVAWYRGICPTGRRMLPSGVECEERVGKACWAEGCVPMQDWLPLMLQMKLWDRWRGLFRRVVANSHHVGAKLTRHGLAVSDVVWNGVPERAGRPVLGELPIALYAGRLVQEKGVDVLLRAFARVPAAARLQIAGDGPERGRLEQLCGELGLGGRVDFLGHLAQADVEKLAARAWVQVAPSIWAEPFGNVAIEAMMRGTAVIASRSGGFAETVVDGETGLLTRPGDVGDLAAALVLYLGNREKPEQAGVAGRSRALRYFSVERMIEDFLRIYKELLADGSGS